MIEHTLPQGFAVTSFSGEIKKTGNDMMMLWSEKPAVSAGMFTTNRVKAACIDWNRKITGQPVHGILANSGNANACTGYRGIQDSEKLASAAGEKYGANPREIMLASTGVIGVPLPVEAMCAALARSGPLDDSPASLHEAARTIMTTDTVEKISSFEFRIDDHTVRISGIAKGSGMIHPNMATMLAFIMTDVSIDPPLLQHLLKNTVEKSFNMISVDGDTSTNDMVLALANGASGVSVKSPDSQAWKKFKEGLNTVAGELAVAIARDGEGATKLIEARVEGASSLQAARTLSRSIVSSSLVKAAMYGEDANWGRVLAAMGYSGAPFDPLKVDILFSSRAGKVQLMKNGSPVSFEEDLAKKVLHEAEIVVEVHLSQGTDKAAAWGCDLTHEYVDINAHYRT